MSAHQLRSEALSLVFGHDFQQWDESGEHAVTDQVDEPGDTATVVVDRDDRAVTPA
jgi:hypothetical protein